MLEKVCPSMGFSVSKHRGRQISAWLQSEFQDSQGCYTEKSILKKQKTKEKKTYVTSDNFVCLQLVEQNVSFQLLLLSCLCFALWDSNQLKL